MNILSHNKQRKKKIGQKWFKKVIEQIKKETNVSKCNSEINVVFVNDRYIKFLNKKYLNRDYPTDVISFTYSRRRNKICGDIFISIPRAVAQSSRYKHSFHKELAFLIIHGFLHLLGYDHMKPYQKIRMNRKAEKILRGLYAKRSKDNY